MQIDLKRVYFNAILGGIGGLVGWALIARLVPEPESGWAKALALAWTGALIGVAIGAALGTADGLIANRSRLKLARGAGYGAALGAAGGAVGIVVGELISGAFSGDVWGKAIGWAVLGTLVGTCDGFAQRMPSKIRYGALGGLLGGLVGGSTYVRITRLMIDLSDNRGFALALGAAIGLVILGACIGALMGLVEALLRRAWLTFTGGSKEGQFETLDAGRERTTLGRSSGCAIVLRDSGVSDRHAVITAAEGRFAVAPDGGRVIVGGRGTLVGPHPLIEGDIVELGTCRFIFHESEV